MHQIDDRDALEALADVLWAERHLVEYLLFKMVTAKLLLAAGERRFMPRAMDEVERVTERLHDAETRREAALLPLARSWGCSVQDLTLAKLAERVEEPMATVFRDLHEGFKTLTAEIEETAATNRRLTNQELGHVRSTLDALTGAGATNTYTARGTHDHVAAGPVRLNEVL